MSKLRSLAGQTAVYGVSSVLGKLFNYALVPLHTMVFSSADLGVMTGLYAYTALFLVIYTFGMETTFFRFASKGNARSTFNATSTIVILISTISSLLIILNREAIANFTEYPGTQQYIVWLAIILWIDGIMAIPFTNLRFENKARYFAIAKVINIILNVGLQVMFLILFPLIVENHWPGYEFISSAFPDIGIGYIFLANLIASITLIPILWKWLKTTRLTLRWTVIKPILIYGFPILITGVSGMINEMLDKILIEKLLPDDFYDSVNSTGALGIYGQTFKLSIFMMLAIQAFRYAGEPFFFNHARDKKAPELFARVMHYFVILSLLIFTLVSINVKLIGDIFLRNSDYRVALFLVPILLFGKFFYGVYLNLSIWFKITDKTIYGTYFSLVGTVITIAGNILLIPIIGYLGSAITSVCCYMAMCIVCYYIGRKQFPIPYNFIRLIPYVITALIIVFSSFHFNLTNTYLDYGLRLMASLIIVFLIYRLEKPKLSAKTF